MTLFHISAHTFTDSLIHIIRAFFQLHCSTWSRFFRILFLPPLVGPYIIFPLDPIRSLPFGCAPYSQSSSPPSSPSATSSSSRTATGIGPRLSHTAAVNVCARDLNACICWKCGHFFLTFCHWLASTYSSHIPSLD